MSSLTAPLSQDAPGAVFFFSAQTHWAYSIIFALTKIYKNLAKMKEGSAVSGHYWLKGIIFVRFLKIFVVLRQFS